MQVAALHLCLAVEQFAQETDAHEEALPWQPVLVVDLLCEVLYFGPLQANDKAANGVLGDVLTGYVQLIRYQFFEGLEFLVTATMRLTESRHCFISEWHFIVHTIYLLFLKLILQ